MGSHVPPPKNNWHSVGQHTQAQTTEMNGNKGEGPGREGLRELRLTEHLLFARVFTSHSIFQKSNELRIFTPLYNKETMLIVTYSLSGLIPCLLIPNLGLFPPF